VNSAFPTRRRSRVKARADARGHSASETTLRRIYEASLRNLRRAVLEMDILWVYDNTSIDASHPLILEALNGEICFLLGAHQE
jgi:predicted ABC-type ATPase